MIDTYISPFSILIGVGIGVGLTFFFISGNQPPTTCDEIKEVLTKNLKGEIELSNKDFEIYVEGMIWCKQVQEERESQKIGDVKE